MTRSEIIERLRNSEIKISGSKWDGDKYKTDFTVEGLPVLISTYNPFDLDVKDIKVTEKNITPLFDITEPIWEAVWEADVFKKTEIAVLDYCKEAGLVEFIERTSNEDPDYHWWECLYNNDIIVANGDIQEQLMHLDCNIVGGGWVWKNFAKQWNCEQWHILIF